jgi:methyl-accepting chemotaxis protein
MADISSASREQGSGIEQVGRAISQIDEVTQQNAALVEQAAAAAESLQEQAQSLSSAVSVFRLSPTRALAEDAADAPVVAVAQPDALVSGKKRAPALLTPKVLEKMNSGRIPAMSTRQTEWAEF